MIKSTLYRDKLDLIKKLVRPKTFVLDIGFFGQGVSFKSKNSPHNILSKITKNLYGLDLDFPKESFDEKKYFRGNAETFESKIKYDYIFAGDIIEHLSNPGFFLESSSKNLKEKGKMIITTPNAFGLFNIIEKIFKNEPTVNKEHTCYFNSKTISELISRYDLKITEISYIYTLNLTYSESFFKKIQNTIYWLLSKFTNKFIETLVIVVEKK